MAVGKGGRILSGVEQELKGKFFVMTTDRIFDEKEQQQ